MTRKSRSRALVMITGMLVVASAALFAALERSDRRTGRGGPAPGPQISIAHDEEVVAAAPDRPASPAVRGAADGRTLFRELECVRCHAAEGVGRARSPLDDVGSRLDAAKIRRWIVAPRSVDPAVRKPAYDDLAPHEVEALVTYLISLSGPP